MSICLRSSMIVNSLLAMVLLFSCADTEMHRKLLQLQRDNQNDSLLTNDSLATALCNYFDNKGSANERLLAHYLLARTYADKRMAPQALRAYHEAVEQVDTLSPDCDFHILSRVYGQMGELLYDYQLPRIAISSYKEAFRYAKRAGEDMVAVCYYAQLSKCYYDLCLPDSAYYVMDVSIRKLLEYGDTLTANSYKGALSYVLTERGDYKQAKQFLDDYEYRSLFNNNLLNEHDDWRLYYVYKGYYYQYVDKLDSSLYFYKKAFETSTSANNKSLACRGLLTVYDKLNESDSIRKYALLYAEQNNLTNKQQTSSSLLGIQHLYEYSHYETLAAKSATEASKANFRFWLLALCFLLALIVTLCLMSLSHYHHVQTKRRLHAKYTADIHGFISMREELKRLQNKEIVSEHLIRQAKENLDYFRRSITTVKQQYQDIENWGLGDVLLKTSIVTELKHKGNKGLKATEHELLELRRAVSLFLPGFTDTLQNLGYHLNINYLTICIMIKLHFTPYQICSLLNMSGPALSNLRKRLLKRLFGVDGSSSLFDDKIRELSFGCPL